MEDPGESIVDDGVFDDGELADEPLGAPLLGEKIWVGVRLRPLSDKEQAVNAKPAWEATPGGSSVLYTGPPPSRAGTRTAFSFDRVFEPHCSNGAVYSGACANVVKAAMEGYHGTGALERWHFQPRYLRSRRSTALHFFYGVVVCQPSLLHILCPVQLPLLAISAALPQSPLCARATQCLHTASPAAARRTPCVR